MKRFLAFFLSFVLLFEFTVHAETIEEPQNLYAQSAVLMDAESGRVLYEKEGNKILAMASTTKIMTCILALERGKLDDVVTVSSNAVDQPKVHLGMREKEQFVLRDLLYSLMLESHNDSAVAIAEHIGGSTEGFANLMNEKAKELGCNHTYFITPNGLDAVDDKGMHATTATDLARIMSYCIMESPKKEEFLEITGTATHSFSNVEDTRTFSCSNRNTFLEMMEGAISGKTGFTGKAGYCYVGAVRQGKRTFVVALLACGWPNNKNYKWKDTKKLMEYAVDNYEYRELEQDVDLPCVEVCNGIPEEETLFETSYAKVKVKWEEGQSFLCRKDERIELTVQCKEVLEAPVREGKIIGEVIYRLDGKIISEVPIIVEESVNERQVSWVFEKVLELYLKLL